ncbi:hypothetical protein GIB67_038477 [Kingdonia uniflora]|uniref:Pentatricopeptide repeat-containing protein n=1 Tax=Kingdonia uniflora TaxID=39325 RepID=A0A7J7NPK6_9MAGN|nr:hypothetical protein GIB67_038477 [Kingdonia uniflora]
MGFLLQSGKTLLNTSTKFNLHQTISILTTHLHTTTTRKHDQTTTILHLCNSLRRNRRNWDHWLSKKLASLELTHNSVVEKVLLELKEPHDAKLALKLFHWLARRPNYHHGVESYCIIVHILVRGKFLIDARVLLESVLRKRVEGGESGFMVVEVLFGTYKRTLSIPFVFDLLVQTYSKLRMFDVAFDAWKYLEENRVSCSLVSFNKLIHLVQKSDKNVLVWKIYEYMIKKRTYPNQFTVSTMINALCKEGKLQDSVDILDRIHGKRCSPGVIVNTSLIFRVIEEGRIDDGIVYLKRMLQKNMIIDDVAYSLTIYARYKSEKFNLESGQKLFDEMLSRGISSNSFLYTLFIGAHCKEGTIDEANWLMEEMKVKGLRPYDETFNVLIEGCARVGRFEESLSFCEEIVKRGLLPSCSVFNEMLRKLCETKYLYRANEMLSVLLDKGFLPNEITYSYLIDGYGRQGEIHEVLKLYHEMEYRSDSSPGLLTYASLLRSLCECDKLKEAEKYLAIMKDRSVTPTSYVYQMLIDSHYKKGDTERALQLKEEMVRSKLEPVI